MPGIRLFLPGFRQNWSISVSCDNKNFRKVTPLYLQVREMLSNTKYWFNPASVSRPSAMVLAERLTGRTSSPSARLRRAETCARVRSALARLAESDRELLVLRHLEQLSLAEIAAVLGTSEATAGKRHLRALERLRGLLAPPFRENEP